MSGENAINVWFLQYETQIIWLSVAIICVGVIQNLIYLFYIPGAWKELQSHSQRHDHQTNWDMMQSRVHLPLTIIVPAYNESATISDSLMSLLGLRYPDYEVIVVNDGSTDRTADVVIEKFDMVSIQRLRDRSALEHRPIQQIYRSMAHPNLILVDKENGKKADAINAGLSCVRTPLFCVIDADSILEPDALLQAVRPFMDTRDNVIAVGGTIGVANGCKVANGQVLSYGLPRRLLPLLQVVEYSRAFLLARLSASRAGTLTLISGAFGIFRRDLAIAVGGYETETVGEDMELVLKLHRHMKTEKTPYQIRYIPDPVCWTEAPADWSFLSKQRIRWQRGALECLSAHKAMLFNPRYGRLGVWTLPQFLLIDVIGPIVEVLGYLLIPLFYFAGVLSIDYLLAFIALVFSFGVFISMMSIVIEQTGLGRIRTPRQILVLLGAAIIENFGYRQLCNIWRIRGFYQHLVGRKRQWGTMVREGFQQANSVS